MSKLPDGKQTKTCLGILHLSACPIVTGADPGFIGGGGGAKICISVGVTCNSPEI